VVIGTLVSVLAIGVWRSNGSPGYGDLSWWRILIAVVLAGSAVSAMADPFAKVAPEKGWWGYWLLLIVAAIFATLVLVIFRREGWFIVEAATAHVIVAATFGVVIPLVMRRS
jgi:Mg/Co/Ni transporter MgtE